MMRKVMRTTINDKGEEVTEEVLEEVEVVEGMPLPGRPAEPTTQLAPKQPAAAAPVAAVKAAAAGGPAKGGSGPTSGKAAAAKVRLCGVGGA